MQCAHCDDPYICFEFHLILFRFLSMHNKYAFFVQHLHERIYLHMVRPIMNLRGMFSSWNWHEYRRISLIALHCNALHYAYAFISTLTFRHFNAILCIYAYKAMLIRNVCIFIKYETSKYNDKRETFTICKYMLNLLLWPSILSSLTMTSAIIMVDALDCKSNVIVFNL